MSMLVQEELFMIKGKRTKRPRPTSPLTLTIATTSSTTAELSSHEGNGCTPEFFNTAHHLAPSPSNSTTQSTYEEDEEEMANCLILLARGFSHPSTTNKMTMMAEIFQCKTCDKSFPSFQALGGHRASHKKSMLEEKKAPFRNDNTFLSLKISNRIVGSTLHGKSKVHECSICGAAFTSGQALGGHMRRHRVVPPTTPATGGDFESREVKKERSLLSLDLNLPAPEEDPTRDSKFSFGNTEQVIVFSASPLVDCHY